MTNRVRPAVGTSFHSLSTATNGAENHKGQDGAPLSVVIRESVIGLLPLLQPLADVVPAVPSRFQALGVSLVPRCWRGVNGVDGVDGMGRSVFRGLSPSDLIPHCPWGNDPLIPCLVLLLVERDPARVQLHVLERTGIICHKPHALRPLPDFLLSSGILLFFPLCIVTSLEHQSRNHFY